MSTLELKSATKLDASLAALLYRASAGNLVPRNPSGEAAPILINRIEQKGTTHEQTR